jgi:predicted transcriptional regulator of viral defense system
MDHWATKTRKIRVSDLERAVIDGLKQSEYCGGFSEVAKGLWIMILQRNISLLSNRLAKVGGRRIP